MPPSATEGPPRAHRGSTEGPPRVHRGPVSKFKLEMKGEMKEEMKEEKVTKGLNIQNHQVDI